MAGNPTLKPKDEQAWAEKIASKYGIFPETVLGIYHGFSGTKRYATEDYQRTYINHKERAEEFFKLYFEGVKGV